MDYLQALTNAADKAAIAQSNFEKLDTQILRGSGTINYGSISAAASEDQTITVTGAAVGDPVIIGLPAAIETGLVFTAFVSAADTVTLRASNITGSPIDPASATFKAMVLRY